MMERLLGREVPATPGRRDRRGAVPACRSSSRPSPLRSSRAPASTRPAWMRPHCLCRRPCAMLTLAGVDAGLRRPGVAPREAAAWRRRRNSRSSCSPRRAATTGPSRSRSSPAWCCRPRVPRRIQNAAHARGHRTRASRGRVAAPRTRHAAETLAAPGGSIEQVAEHWQASAEPERASAAWLEAAPRSRRLYAHQDAVQQLRRALDLAATCSGSTERLAAHLSTRSTLLSPPVGLPKRYALGLKSPTRRPQPRIISRPARGFPRARSQRPARGQPRLGARARRAARCRRCVRSGRRSRRGRR